MTLLSPDQGTLRCWAEIDLSAIRHNARVCQALLGDRAELMAIVKADAYGHGLERVATALANEVDWFGVANVREAQRARTAAGTEIPVLILSPAISDEIPLIVEGRFSASVSTLAEVEAFSEEAKSRGLVAKIHAVADTGMGRMGARPDEFENLVRGILASPHCKLEGVETHFPSADEDEAFTKEQIETFRSLLDSLDLPDSCRVHLGNSAGLLAFQDQTPFANLARPGLALYGISPFSETPHDLRPALQLKTRITLVRDVPEGTSISYGRTFISERPMRLATLGVGYGDGYPRALSGRNAHVLIGGHRCPLLGRVTMDQIVVDVSALPVYPTIGEEAILIGKQGEEEITADETAMKAGTIPWEVLTGITSRVERVYRHSG